MTENIAEAKEEEKVIEVQIETEEAKEEVIAPEKTEKKRYRGFVTLFYSRKGYGFIRVVDGRRELNSPRLFVHWQQIQTNDRWPKLQVGQEVEFYIEEKEGKQFAGEVTPPGGGLISNGPGEAQIITETKIKGRVKFFNPRRGFGFVALLEDFSIDGKDHVSAGTDIHVGRESIISTNPCPILEDGQVVCFMLQKSKRGYQAIDVSDENGEPIHIENYEQVKRTRSKRSSESSSNVKRPVSRQQKKLTFPHFGNVTEWSDDSNSGWIQPTGHMIEQRPQIKEKISFGVGSILPGSEVKKGDDVCFVLDRSEDGVARAKEVFAVDRSDLFFKTRESAGKFFYPSLLSIIVEDSVIPRIIGKKGGMIREINSRSGSFVQVVDVDQQHRNKRIMNITGYAHTIQKACHLIMETIYGDGDFGRMTFVFHDVHRMMGRLIGKKGTNVNILRRIPGLTVKVKKCNPFMGQPMASLRLEGDPRSVAVAINVSVDMLVKLYFETVKEYFSQAQAFQGVG